MCSFGIKIKADKWEEAKNFASKVVDSDKDGKLGVDELKKYADTDGNNEISATEAEALKKELSNFVAKEDVADFMVYAAGSASIFPLTNLIFTPEKPVDIGIKADKAEAAKDFLAKADSDKDGKISPQELKVYSYNSFDPDGKGKGKVNRGEERNIRNIDGKISPVEADALRNKLSSFIDDKTIIEDMVKAAQSDAFSATTYKFNIPGTPLKDDTAPNNPDYDVISPNINFEKPKICKLPVTQDFSPLTQDK